MIYFITIIIDNTSTKNKPSKHIEHADLLYILELRPIHTTCCNPAPFACGWIQTANKVPTTNTCPEARWLWYVRWLRWRVHLIWPCLLSPNLAWLCLKGHGQSLRLHRHPLLRRWMVTPQPHHQKLRGRGICHHPVQKTDSDTSFVFQAKRMTETPRAIHLQGENNLKRDSRAKRGRVC